MQAVADAMGTDYSDCCIRAKQIGVRIGNCWDKKPSVVGLKMLFLVNSGLGVKGADQILLQAKDTRGFHMFEKVE